MVETLTVIGLCATMALPPEPSSLVGESWEEAA